MLLNSYNVNTVSQNGAEFFVGQILYVFLSPDKSPRNLCIYSGEQLNDTCI